MSALLASTKENLQQSESEIDKAKKKQGTMADNPVKSYSEKLSQAITPKAPTTIPESAPRNVNRFQIKESKITTHR